MEKDPARSSEPHSEHADVVPIHVFDQTNGIVDVSDPEVEKDSPDDGRRNALTATLVINH